MTTTLQALGGGAQPASIDTSGKTMGGPALRVYGFDSEADAQAAGYVCEGGPAMSVALITDAQIASGTWKAEGDPSALVVYTAPGNMPVEGGLSVPVYPVNGWGSTPAPSGPQFDSAEIGTVNASTLVVTFDSNVDASNYATGVTIKVNGTATSITSAIRQSDNHAKVNYLIPVLWHGSGDAMTWEYASGSGNIVAESGGAALADVTAQSATNNCEYAALLDLQADTLALNDGDPISTWADQSGNSRDFTQTGSARPAKQTISGFPAVFFDSLNTMLCNIFVDDIESLEVVSVVASFANGMLPSVIGNLDGNGNGFYINNTGEYIAVSGNNGTSNLGGENYDEFDDVFKIRTAIMQSFSNQQQTVYLNGDNSGYVQYDSDVFNSYHTAATQMVIGDNGITHGGEQAKKYIRAILVYSPIPNNTNRAALEARLAARYGVTLP